MEGSLATPSNAALPDSDLVTEGRWVVFTRPRQLEPQCEVVSNEPPSGLLCHQLPGEALDPRRGGVSARTQFLPPP